MKNDLGSTATLDSYMQKRALGISLSYQIFNHGTAILA